MIRSADRARRSIGSPRIALWLAASLYTVVVLVPLFLILLGPQSAKRGFWVEFGVALGFIGLAMLCLQSVLTARYPKLSGTIGQDTMLQFHRQAGIVAFAFVLAHPVVLILADSGYWEFLDPRVNFLRAVFLVFALFALPGPLEPEQQPGLDFRAGQFVFLTVADQPFALEQHPFSIASSDEERDRLEFAVKELGDHTRTIGATPVGQRAFVDGPYGSLRLPHDRGARIMLIAGGIGISPVMSMLRTMRQSGHAAPVVLLYAADRVEDLAFDGELDELSEQLPLTVTRILRDPPPGWPGAIGLVDASLIGRHLSDTDASTCHVVLCGPAPMMDAAERALSARGVPLRNIHSERFDIGAAGAVGQRGAQVRRLVAGLSLAMLAAAALFAL